MANPEAQNVTPPAEAMERSVVYRRTDSPDGGPSGVPPQPQKPSSSREIAPAVTPLIIGFTLLLIVIFVLGYLSTHRIDLVGTQVLDLEQQYTARISLLLNMRLALTRLNNEARARQDADAGKGLRPPFDVRLSTAREEMNKLRPVLDRPPFSESPSWARFRNDLDAYVKVTEDPRQYSLEGFAKFRTVDIELNDLINESTRGQLEVFE